MNNPYSAAARQLITKHYTPIPLDGKVPVVKGWQNLRNVTEAQIDEWERAGLWKNIGLVCGEASDNIVVIDFDGLAGYEVFCREFPDLADTFTVATGSGKGRHVYFKVDLLPDSLGFMDVLDGCNIEIKSNGKQVVIPPSIHPDTKQPYTKAIATPIKCVTDIQDIIAWGYSLKPEDWRPPVVARFGQQDPINPRVVDALRAHFESQPHKAHGDWINCSCPNRHAHKHGDKVFSFGYNVRSGVGHCYVCKSILTKTLCEYVHIDPDDYGGLFERQQSAAPVVPYGNGYRYQQAAPPQPPAPLKIVTRDERITDYLRNLFDPDSVNEMPPVAFPLRVLHKYGGMARVARAGKIMALVGVSGTGKTSLMETMIDAWLMMGIGVLLWSPEWDADEFIDRAIQRYGGVSVEDLWLYDLYKSERADGITQGFMGKPLTKEQLTNIKTTYSMLQSWRGKVGYIEEKSLTVERLEVQLGDALAQLPYRPRVLLIDYLQLMAAAESEQVTMYDLCMRVKAVCGKHKLFAVASTQATKAAAKDSKKFGDVLDVTDARYVNDDAFNLFITVTPEYNSDTREKLNTVIFNVGKNSLGRTGKVRVGVNWERLWFSDKESDNQYFGEAI